MSALFVHSLFQPLGHPQSPTTSRLHRGIWSLGFDRLIYSILGLIAPVWNSGRLKPDSGIVYVSEKGPDIMTPDIIDTYDLPVGL